MGNKEVLPIVVESDNIFCCVWGFVSTIVDCDRKNKTNICIYLYYLKWLCVHEAM